MLLLTPGKAPIGSQRYMPRFFILTGFDSTVKSELRQWMKGFKMGWLSARNCCVFCVVFMVSSQSICLENQLSLILWYLWYFSFQVSNQENVSAVCSHGNEWPRYPTLESYSIQIILFIVLIFINIEIELSWCFTVEQWVCVPQNFPDCTTKQPCKVV